jgi:hypothetical protein
MGQKRNVYRLFEGKPEGKRLLGRPRRGWVEIGSDGLDWIGLAQDRYKWRALVNAGSIKCWETIE